MTRTSISGAALIGSMVAPLAAAALLLGVTPSFAEGPFASFAGNWTGTGMVSTTGGAKERLRCRAHYDIGGDGNTLSQNLTCASDSYKFNVVAQVQAEGGNISGSWSETSRNANGKVSGTITPTQVSAYVTGLGFTARMGIAARGGKQSITINPTGTDIANVSVTMSKG